MPNLTMPDGSRVKFPDNMTNDEITFLIRKKYPDAQMHRGLIGQLWRGGEQGVASTALDISSGFGLNQYLPSIPFLGGELPGLPQYARQAREQAMQETKKFANEPSEGPAQSIGKVAGGTAPYLLMGPTGLVADAFEAGSGVVGRNLHHIAAEAVHLLGHKLGAPRWVTAPIANWVRSGLANVAAQAGPTAMARGAGAVGQAIESRVAPLAVGGGHAYIREPSRERPEPKSAKSREPERQKPEEGYVYYSR